jgi:hypothetical protein
MDVEANSARHQRTDKPPGESQGATVKRLRLSADCHLIRRQTFFHIKRLKRHLTTFAPRYFTGGAVAPVIRSKPLGPAR